MIGEMDPTVRFIGAVVIMGLLVIDMMMVAAFSATAIGRLWADMWFPNRRGARRSRIWTLARFAADVAIAAIFTAVLIGLNVLLAVVFDGMATLESALNAARSGLSYVGGFVGAYLPQVIVILGVLTSFLLFRLKARHKVKYGSLEAIFAVVAMISVSSQVSVTPQVISAANIAFAGAVYVFIRGLTNIYEGTDGEARKQFDAWFLGRGSEEDEPEPELLP